MSLVAVREELILFLVLSGDEVQIDLRRSGRRLTSLVRGSVKAPGALAKRIAEAESAVFRGKG
jgi:hypothetical protein